jgi:hypothetical protein
MCASPGDVVRASSPWMCQLSLTNADSHGRAQPTFLTRSPSCCLGASNRAVQCSTVPLKAEGGEGGRKESERGGRVGGKEEEEEEGPLETQ